MLANCVHLVKNLLSTGCIRHVSNWHAQATLKTLRKLVDEASGNLASLRIEHHILQKCVDSVGNVLEARAVEMQAFKEEEVSRISCICLVKQCYYKTTK